MQKVEGTNSHSFKNEILGLLWQVWSEVVRLISRDYVHTINPFSSHRRRQWDPRRHGGLSPAASHPTPPDAFRAPPKIGRAMSERE